MNEAPRSPARPSRILISDGETRPALAVTRSLARAGYRIEVLSSSLSRSRAGSSRYASEVHLVADASEDPEAWARDVVALLDREPDQLLIPITEVALGSLFAAGLDARPDTLTPDPEAYREMTDKAALVERAASLGIDVPRSLFVEDPASLTELPAPFDFPVILKPRTSRWFEGGHWQSGDVRIARDPQMLVHYLADPGMANGLLLQEFLPGHGESVCLLTESGETRARFGHRRLREKPPSGGVSVLSESRRPDVDLLEASEKLLASVHWDGIAMVEFRRCPDGRAALMEVNPRFWGSLQLAIDAGIDFPRLAVALRYGQRFPVPEVQEGRRLRWLLGDFDHLWMVVLRSPRGSLPPFGRLRALGGFFASFFDGSKLEIERLSDPRPAWADFLSWLR